MFRAETSDEFGVLTNSGGQASYQNIGHTLRQGVEASLAWRVAKTWRADVALTALTAVYRDDFLTCTNISCTRGPRAGGRRQPHRRDHAAQPVWRARLVAGRCRSSASNGAPAAARL